MRRKILRSSILWVLLCLPGALFASGFTLEFVTGTVEVQENGRWKKVDIGAVVADDALLRMAQIYDQQLKDADKAMETWLEIVKQFSGTAVAEDASWKIARYYEQHKEPAKAIDAYKAFLRNYRRSPKAGDAQAAIAENYEHLDFISHDRFGVGYSWKYVPELLHKLGFSVQRPRKKLSRADHEAQEFWFRETLPRLKKQPAASGL